MFGCDELREMRDRLAELAGRFDAGGLDGETAAALVKDAAAIENMAAALRAQLARRVEATHAWRKDGYRSAAHQLAQEAGISVGKAKAELETALRLQLLPATAQAHREGKLSADKAAAVADAASADPSAEQRLVEHAQRRSLGELRDECARVKAAADPDPDATHKRIHAARTCRRRTTVEGGGEIVYGSTLEEVNEVWAVLKGFATTEFDKARLQGRREPEDAYAADGMLAMARAAAGAATGLRPTATLKGRVRRPVPTKIIFRCDVAALRRGHVQGDEVCDIAGVGPVPVSVIRDVLETGDPFVAAVLTDGVDVISVAHLGRKPTAHQLTALEWRQ